MRVSVRHVSSVVLVWVALSLGDNFVAIAAQTSDTFANIYLEDLDLTVCSLIPDMCLCQFPIQFKENATSPVFSFSTKFKVNIQLGAPLISSFGYGGSTLNRLDGFTFALLPHPNASLGGDGGYLGLLNATANGDPQSHTLAVEFDFEKNSEFSDPDEGFHVGIDINSMNSTSWFILPGPESWTAYWELQVWIDYDASSQILNVSAADISKIACPLDDKLRPGRIGLRINDTYEIFFGSVSQKVDLSNVLNERMYVGFTSYSKISNFSDSSDASCTAGAWSLRTSNSTSHPIGSDPLRCYRQSNHPFEVRMASALFSLTALAVIYAVLYKYYRRREERRGWRFQIDPDDLGDADPHKFTYKELAMATKNFDPKQALGRGGFGSVYKGFLPGNHQYVAVKRVAPESSQGEREFLAEVLIIGKIRHRNLVRLQGWCHERGELLLVCDYMPQGSLDKHLFVSPVAAREDLASTRDQQEGVRKLVAQDEEVVVGFPWTRRFKVVVDVATTLVYLHTECEERIIHRDVKAANVMLDAKFNAHLGDFGLARCYNHSVLAPESTNVAGTFGYFAPELFHTGKQTEQTDVYSFGAFLLEVACGKKPIFHEVGEVKLLVDQVWHLWGNSRILEAADARLAGTFHEQEMTQVLCLGLLCSHPSPVMRPSMRQVLLILNGDIPLPEVPVSKPQFDYLPRSAPHDVSCTSNASSMYYTASTTRGERI